MRKDGNPYAAEYLDCASCKARNPAAIRNGWNCGLERSSRWIGPGFPAPHEWNYRPEPLPDEEPRDYAHRRARMVCPGYLINLPQVIETAMCNRWFDKGLLLERLDGTPVTQLLRDALDILTGAIGEVESHMMAGATRG